MLEFKYFPNSYNFELIDSKNISKREFLQLQIKYKSSFEKLLMQIIDFTKIDDYIKSFGIEIPMVNDIEYNFYHKFSLLKSKYIYFRNNIHVENLSDDEIKTIYSCLIDDSDLNPGFLLSSYSRVLYEPGDIAMFDLPVDESKVSAKSLVFEFAYDQKMFSSIKQYNLVKELLHVIYLSLSKSIKNVIDTDISMISYNAIPDIYLLSEENIEKSFK